MVLVVWMKVWTGDLLLARVCELDGGHRLVMIAIAGFDLQEDTRKVLSMRNEEKT